MGNINNVQKVKEYIFAKAELLGLKDSEMGSLAGITRANVNRWKNGDNEIRLSSFLNLCEGLGINLPELIATPNPVKIIDGTDLTKAGLEAARNAEVDNANRKEMLDTCILLLPWESLESPELCRYRALLQIDGISKGLVELAKDDRWDFIKPTGPEIGFVESDKAVYTKSGPYSKNELEGWMIALLLYRRALAKPKRSKK